jgi:hypothetical protein
VHSSDAIKSLFRALQTDEYYSLIRHHIIISNKASYTSMERRFPRSKTVRKRVINMYQAILRLESVALCGPMQLNSIQVINLKLNKTSCNFYSENSLNKVISGGLSKNYTEYRTAQAIF